MRLAWIIVLLCAALSIRGEGQGRAARPATPLEVIPAILDAFRTHRIVSYPGGHTDGNEVHAQLRALIRDPRFASTVNDIVVEFGSSRYQDLMDRYIRGDDISDSAIGSRGSMPCREGRHWITRTRPRSSAPCAR